MRQLLLLIFGICLLLGSAHCWSKKKVKMSDFDKVRLDKKGFEKVEQIHYNWYIHSIKALMGQLGKDLLRKLNKGQQRTLLACLDRIQDKRDIVSAAQCLVDARDDFDIMKEQRAAYRNFVQSSSKKEIIEMVNDNSRTKWSGGFLIDDITQELTTPAAFEMDFNDKGKTLPTVNTINNDMRSSFIQENVNAETPTTETPPITLKLQKSLRIQKIRKNGKRRKIRPMEEMLREKLRRRYESILRSKDNRNLSKYGDGKNILRRVKRSPYRLIADHVQKSDSQKFVITNMEKMPSLKEKENKSPVRRVSNLILQMVKGGDNSTNGTTGSWTESYKGLLDLKKHMDAKAKEPGAKVYDLRMYDIVLGREEPSESFLEKAHKPTFIEDAYKLVNSFTGKKGSMKSKNNFKFLSPRFAPIMPDKYGPDKGSLSPSILSFYNDEAEEQIFPLPKMLDATGMSEKDRETVLETIMEVSGARETVDDALKILKNTQLFGMDGEIMEVTKKITEIFAELSKSFKGYQNKEIKRRGFTFMEPNQMDKLMEKQGISDRKDHGFDMESYKTLSRSQKEESLWLRIRQIAGNSSELDIGFNNATGRRTKRSMVSVLKPTVLAPYMFTPIFGLTVLGPCVLSPSLFSPLILNPAVLSPYVLSPAVAMPFILSPYVLSPYVLSPLVMAPFILTPYVLSPNVINPYVLSPVILSPVVLGPDVLSPMILGGNILSPTVLSPSVLSPTKLMLNVLSPTFLS